MLLTEVLSKLSEDTPLKIGAAGGSSYFYCGTAGDFRKRIAEYSTKSLRVYDDSVRRAKAALEEHIRRKPPLPRVCEGVGNLSYIAAMDELDECARDTNKVPRKLKFLSYIQALGSWSAKVGEYQERVQKAIAMMDAFAPFCEREVETVFFSDPTVEPEQTVSIHIKGYECGSYWTISDAIGSPNVKQIAVSTKPKGVKGGDGE